jgi:DNA ligase-1
MTNQWQRWKGIQKCYPFEEKRLLKWKPPYVVQPKYDGIRCRAIPIDNNKWLLLSSEENPIFSVPHLNNILERIFTDPLKREELDGELYCHGLSFEEITSITSRTVNLHPEHTKIQFHLFDLINNQPQINRILAIQELKDKSPWLVVAPFYLCNNLDEVLKAYDKVINQNFEGIIVRNIDAPYKRKRSTWVMKFKPKQSDEYEITGFQEEIDKEGIPKDSLGALVCKSGDGNVFNVGTGFTEEERKTLWEVRGILNGNSAIVKYQHITSGNKVPRFPVFVEIKWNS